METNIIYKDLFYYIGSGLGIISFFLTIKKREKCEFNYRTELGDEVRPFLICIRGDMFNLTISNNEQSVFALKYPNGINLSRIKYKELDERLVDYSSFYPVLKETEVISIPNDGLDMKKISLHFEDKYHNKYFQTLEFNLKDVSNPDRAKRKSRSCYILSKRKYRFLWIWFPWCLIN